ncbi:MAG: RES family NAD+ phosphorylase [Euzebya sp.]
MGTGWFQVHDQAYPPPAFNMSGHGDTRFAPLAGAGHKYVARRQTVALLETVFHDVHEQADRIIYTVTALHGRQLSQVDVEARLPLVDLRDPELERLGVDRGLVTSSRAHYPCTRQWGDALIGRRPGGALPAGWIWNSRVAELAQAETPLLQDLLEAPASEVAVLYDLHTPAGILTTTAPLFNDLTTGNGWLFVAGVAELLDAEIH